MVEEDRWSDNCARPLFVICSPYSPCHRPSWAIGWLRQQPAKDPAISVALVVRSEEVGEPGKGLSRISLIPRAGKAATEAHCAATQA